MFLRTFGGGCEIRTHAGLPPNGFQDFSCYGNITLDRGFCATLLDADFSLVERKIDIFDYAIGVFSHRKGRIVSNVFSNKILEKTLEEFNELWGVATQIVRRLLSI